jgi:hypothetical protein
MNEIREKPLDRVYFALHKIIAYMRHACNFALESNKQAISNKKSMGTFLMITYANLSFE